MTWAMLPKSLTCSSIRQEFPECMLHTVHMYTVLCSADPQITG